MKRPPGLWILLSAGFLWLSLDDVYGIRATSLIFAKSSTTTTTTTTTDRSEIVSDDEGITTEQNGDSNSTLTGNPQIDYVWDPNLPKELNGYNLSDYPFYERVPEDIDFKCDGLHDGFYASVKHKCQVYHHCLFGTRYDFLCANYTAFDQKTFICHFASEVDCANSKKFWHRNDALYKSASTTTTTTTSTITPLPPAAAAPAVVPLEPPGIGARRPYAGQRRPLRRRPQYDYYDEEYYDDYYEDRPRSNRGRKRPRPRPRPYYEDEYDDEYEDDKYERRGGGGRRNEKRRPYDRKSNNRQRNKDRTRIEYDEDERVEDDDYKTSSRRKNNDRNRDSDYVEDSYERNYGRRHNSNAKNNYSKRNRKPIESEDEDRSYENDKSQKKKEISRETTSSKPRPIIKTVGGTIYDKPRVAPKIKLPVPKNEANKYAYKPLTKSEYNSKESHEYEEDEYEEDINDSKKFITNSNQHQGVSKKRPIRFKRPLKQYDSYESYETSHENMNNKNKQPKPDTEEEYYDDYEDDIEEDFSAKSKNVYKITPTSSVSTTTPKPTTITTSAPSSTTTTTTTSTIVPAEINIVRVKEPLIRLVKRPFLPSRGGNPYTQRGLQPVGARALNKSPDETGEEFESREFYKSEEQTLPTSNQQPVFKPSPMVINMSSTGVTFPSSQNFQPIMKTTLNYQERTTHSSKLPEKNSLDISDDEYDVTINDALNPTLPNLPIRGYPSGFSTKDYPYSNFQRGTFNTDQDKSPTRYEYVYEPKPPSQRYQIIPQTDVREHFVHSSADFKGQYSVINENYRPLPVQNTQAFFRRY